jgi:hypothetical protein
LGSPSATAPPPAAASITARASRARPDGGTTRTPATTATSAPGATSVLARTPINDDNIDEANENLHPDGDDDGRHALEPVGEMQPTKKPRLGIPRRADWRHPRPVTSPAWNAPAPCSSFGGSELEPSAGAGGSEAKLALESWRLAMNNLIYIVGLVVVVIAILSFFGLR